MATAPTPIRTAPRAPMRAAALRASNVRVVGAAFLRTRPWLVAPVAATNVVALSWSGAPTSQRLALGVPIATAFALFCAEAWYFRARVVSERWFVVSLGLTFVALLAGCFVSGGMASPLVPLLLAPVVVGMAAFGRTRTMAPFIAGAAAGVLALAAVPPPFAPLDAAAARWMTVATIGGAAALVLFGVDALVDAHARAAELLDEMRVAALEESASRMRATEQVGAKVAHELKNPLAAVRALVQLVEQGADDPRVAMRCGVALTEIDRMDGIVRDYLAFSRPLADLERRAVDAAELARETVAVLEARAALAGVELRVETSQSSVTATVDPRRVREALVNVVANAIEASPRGGRVSIVVTRRERAVELRVEDEGPGMPEELGSADRPFFTNKEDGTGLGLVIARGAVRQHGGELTFTRAAAGGTIATIVLPDAIGDGGA